jgi:microcystin-dependent protein
LGETGGAESVTLLTANLPPHSHLIRCDGGAANGATPDNSFFGNPGAGKTHYYESSADSLMAASAVQVVGSGLPISLRDPFLGINYIIALEGIFPSRN